MSEVPKLRACVQAAFERFDTGRTGTIDREHLIFVLRKIGLTPIEAVKAVDRFADAPTGEVNYNQFFDCILTEDGDASFRKNQADRADHGSHTQPTYWRAITLRQLMDIIEVIRQRCEVEKWVSTKDWKTPLTPKMVTLYDLNYYVILPSTLLDPVSMAGLPERYYMEGEEVRQERRGKGKVKSCVEKGTEVQVQVTEGHFVSGHEVAIGTSLVKEPRISVNTHFSYVGMLTCDAQKPKWFVSHWWGEPCFEFAACLKTHGELHGLDEDTPYWCCAYANDQHNLGGDVCTDPTQTSFFRALTSEGCEGVLLILPASHHGQAVAMPFRRAWCIYEIFIAITRGEKKLEIVSCSSSGQAYVITEGLTESEKKDEEVLPGSGWENKMYREQLFPMEVLTSAMKVKIQDAQASEQQDQKHILNAISGRPLEEEPVKDHKAYEHVNRVLRGLLAVIAWPQALCQGLVEEFGLPSALKEDDQRKHLELSFSAAGEKASGSAHQGALDDAALCLLAEHLPLNLSGNVAFDFSHCTGIGHAGVAALGQALSRYKCLRTLSMDLSNSSIDVKCVQELGSSIKELASLTSLTFKCGSCADIADDATMELMCGIGSLSCLKILVFSLEFCAGVADKSLAALGNGVQKLCKSLTHLTIDCTHCREIGDEGIRCFSSGVKSLALLVRLNLSFHGCQKITHEGAEALGSALGMLGQLESLHLSLELCTGINHAGITCIVHAARELKSLQEIAFIFPVAGGRSEQVSSLSDLQRDTPERQVATSQPGASLSAGVGCRLRGRHILLLTDFKFWDEEYHHTRSALEAQGAQVRVAARYDPGIELIGQQNGMCCRVDHNLEKMYKAGDHTVFDAVFIPGGAAPQALRHNEAAQKIIAWMVQEGRVAAAICHGVKLLGSAGVLKGAKCTSYSGIKLAVKQYGADWSDQEVVVDEKSSGGTIITSRTPPDLPAFCRAVVVEVERRVPATEQS